MTRHVSPSTGSGSAQKVDQQRTNRFRLFLLDPMPRAVEQIATNHLGASTLLHALKRAWLLISTPVALARDED
jgi:hypothetical protein